MQVQDSISRITVSTPVTGMQSSPSTQPAQSARLVSTAESLHASKLMRTSRVFYFLGLAALLVLFSPVAWIPTSFLKLGVFGLFLALSVICFSAAGGMMEYIRSRRLAWLAVLLLPLVYLLSWWFSTDKAVGLLGVGNEVDSVLFTVAAFAAFFMGNALMRTTAAVSNFLKVLAGIVAISVLFQIFEMFIGVHLFPSIFGDPTFNTIGKWNDFGIFVALGAVLAMGRLELFENSRIQRIALWATFAVGVVLLAIVNFNVAWFMVLAGAAVVSGFQFLAMRTPESSSGVSRQWGAATMAVVAALFIGWGAIINGHLPPFLSIPSLEVRPGFPATYQIATQAHTSVGRMLIGSGPNTFDSAWLVHKPSGVNETQFWSLDFTGGFSTITTAYESVGILGVIAWMLPFFVILLGLWRLIKTGNFSPQKKISALLGGGSLILWGALMFYASGQAMVLFTFAFAGAFMATLSPARTEVTQAARITRMGSAALALAMVVLVIFLAGALGRRSLSIAYAQQGALALNAGNLTAAVALVNKSESIEHTGENARLGVAVDTAALQKLLTAKSSSQSQSDLQQQFQNLVADAINNQGQMAIALQPNNYQSYASLAGVYDLLVPLKVQGAYQKSQEMYEKAMALNPSDPTLPLLLARTEATENLSANVAGVTKLVNESLALKSNYTDALLFNEQLAVSNNDLPGATKEALAAAQSSPSDPSLWFQLGLYYYAGKDWRDAGAALSQAVVLEPDYANAKYFLGLAYYNVGDSKDALSQFTDIQKTNPDNSSIKAIVANLRAGKDPFAGAPSASSSPQKAKKAPIKE